MKYYIVGKTSEKGPTYDDSGDLNSYYEFGWELMVTHIRVKKMKHLGIFKDEDVVVTTNDDRKYLYERNFKKVISWNEFLKIEDEDKIVIDLVNDSVSGSYEFDLPEINNVELNDILKSFVKNTNIISKIVDKKYVCLQFRKRVWCAERNIDEDFFKDLVNFFTVEQNLDVYIMGLDGDVFCDNKKSFYVNLEEFTTLINNSNCLLFYSGMSGPAHLSYFFGHKKLLHIVNSVGGPRPSHLQNHPLYMGDIYNLTGVDVKILPNKLEVSDFNNFI